MMQLNIDTIRTDGGTQPRAAYHFGIAESYAEDMESGAAFPPVTVFYDGTDYWLADGFHRVFAAQKIGRAEIDADVRPGTLQDAQWYSYGVNQAHGLRRSNDDKRRAVEAALRHAYATEMSDRDVAEHCGVSHMLVNNIRNELKPTVKNLQSTSRAGRDGRTINTANIGKKKPAPAPQPSAEPDDADETTEPPIVQSTHMPDPDEQFDAMLSRFSVGLRDLVRCIYPRGLSEDDYQRMIDIFASAVAVDA